MFFCLQLFSVFDNLLVEAERHGSDASGILTVGIGRCGTVRRKRHIGMMKDVILEIPDGALSAYKKKCVLVVQHTHFVRCHQLSSGKLIVGGIASVSAARPSVGIRIDGLLAQQLGNILVGTLLVAAQVQKFIAVAHNTFPLLLEQGFQLRKVLDDDGDGNLTASHGGQELIKLIRQGDIGKLVHDKMHMHGQSAAVNGVGLIVELLKQLGIKHTHDEIEGTVIIGNYSEYRRFLFADLP